MGLYRMLQQRSIPEIIFPMAEDVAKLSEALWEWWLAWF